MEKKEYSNQDVSAALELLNSTLMEEKKRIFDSGAAAMQKQDRETAKQVLDFVEKLEEFRFSVQTLVEKWNELLIIRDTAAPKVQEIVTGEGRLFAKKPRKTGYKRKIDHPIARKTLFKVTFEDGTVIAENKATETLLKAVAKIGVERVFNLNLTCCGEPFLSETQSQKYPTASKKLGKYYLLTHSNTALKVKMLKEIVNKLSIKAETEIFEP